MVVNIIII